MGLLISCFANRHIDIYAHLYRVAVNRLTINILIWLDGCGIFEVAGSIRILSNGQRGSHCFNLSIEKTAGLVVQRNTHIGKESGISLQDTHLV